MRHATLERIKRLQRDRQGDTLSFPLYACTVDGQLRTMRLLEAIMERDLLGRTVEIGAVCGVEYEPKPTAE